MCPIHGIVLGPFGRCVICERAESGESDDPGGGRKVVGLLLLLLAGFGGALVVKGVTGKREAPLVAVAPPPVAPAPVVEEPEPVDEVRAVAQVKASTEEQQRSFEAGMRRVEVSVYTTRWCQLCTTAKDWMKSKHYPFTDVDAEATPENLAALRKVNPEATVPTFVVDGDVFVGFGPGTLQGAMFRAAQKRAR